MKKNYIALLFFLLLTTPAAGETRDINLAYKIYVGGFHVIDLRAEIGLAPEKYDFAVKVKTSGMIGSLFPWWMKAYSRGDIGKEQVKPVAAGQQNNWRGKGRFIDLKFKDGVAIIDRILPKPETDNRDRVSKEMRTGVVDLTSAIISVIRRMDGTGDCEAHYPVFDGRRRYDLVIEAAGSEWLKPSGYTPFVGDTVNCKLSIDKKAGFKRKDESGWNNGRRTAKVWMGKAFDGVPPVPIRLTLKTPLGDLIAHLSAASIEKDGLKKHLRDVASANPKEN